MSNKKKNNKKCYDNYVSMKHEVILIREERNNTKTSSEKKTAK